ncbi:MAG: lysylphosphatidylglycerol synthase transmembrane domain-containing protein [Alphaproteobacteria bacterium]|nr:lysylphosphatidylglycerol synthase transmembrane domain-containing protein [Alphaproteobacteria bacterium]
MPKPRIARLAVSALLLLSVVSTVFWVSDAQALAAAWPTLLASSVAMVAALLLVGVALSSLRLKLIASDLGYRLTFRDAAMTLSVGQIVGNAVFQFAGQLIGRGAVLSRRGIPPAATVVISGYERVVALSVSLLLAGCGALYLFGTLSINLESGGVPLIKLALGLAAVLAAGVLFAWGPALVSLVRTATPELLYRLFRSFVISLAIQGTTLAAYVALESALAPHIGIASLAAASCIVMLAASLPISFGGWGLRELSAVVALQAIGLTSAAALLIALVIGFMSLAVVAITALVILVGWRPQAQSAPAIADPAAPDYAAALDWLLPLMAATAVFFQIYIPTGSGRISVNLADPVVVLGASLLALHHFGKAWPVWRIANVGAWVAAASAVILLSTLNGWAVFGWTDWAFVNKGLGWLVPLCYGATGALIVGRARQNGLEFLLKTLATTGAAIALIEIALSAANRLGLGLAGGLVEFRISAFSQNANAFAFMLTLVLSAAIVLRERSAVRVGLMAVALAGIWFAGSRAGFLAAPAVLLAAWMMGVAPRPMVLAVLAAGAGIAAVMALPSLVQLVTFATEIAVNFAARLVAQFAEVPTQMLSSSSAASAPWPERPTRELFAGFGCAESVTLQHIQTVKDGLRMFLAHPLFGAGLGAYMELQTRLSSEPQMIHSTLVWLLAEIGLAGTAVFLAAAWRLLIDALRRRGDPAALLLLLILCSLAVMSLVHEMLYQRAFWLLLGAVLAMPTFVSRCNKTEER